VLLLTASGSSQGTKTSLELARTSSYGLRSESVSQSSSRTMRTIPALRAKRRSCESKDADRMLRQRGQDPPHVLMDLAPLSSSSLSKRSMDQRSISSNTHRSMSPQSPSSSSNRCQGTWAWLLEHVGRERVPEIGRCGDRDLIELRHEPPRRIAGLRAQPFAQSAYCLRSSTVGQ